jgi:hypothetical protein
MVYKLAVGQPLLPGKSALPTATNYNFRGGQHELLLILDALSDRETEAVRTGPCDFALLIFRGVLFLLYRFGDTIPWSDCPYSIWLVKPEERIAPQKEGPDTRALLTIVLVDADTNTVRAIRAVTLSPDFTATLHTAIRSQLSEPISIFEYNETINQAYQQWPDTNKMLRSAIVRTKGGL